MKTPARLEYPPDRLRALRTALKGLREHAIFTVWRWVQRDDKPQKVPLHPAGAQGVTLDQALARYKADKSIAGLGVKLGPIPGSDRMVLWGADYDGEAKGPLPAAWPKARTYIETSPSGGDKFHLLGMYKGEPYQGKRQGAVEIYSAGRFFTLTGERINGAAILETDPLPYYSAIGCPQPQPYAAHARSAAPAPVGEPDLTQQERKYAERVRGMEDEDESRRDFKVCADLAACGASDQEIERVLCALFWRDKLARKDYVARTIAKAREEAEKAKAFREESRAIGEGPQEADLVQPLLNVDQMLVKAVFISEGSLVALRDDPRFALSLADFENLMAASIVHSGGKGRPPSVVRIWLRHPQRATVHTRTFKAGAPLFCQSPDDVPAINTWREPPRTPPPADWSRRAEPFLEHINFLVQIGDEREFFLDWLAHIEQQPGVLPHVHVLMYTPRQGVGRNWMTSVLARAWPSVTALDVDLPALLNGGFNGRLSRKVFAVVNEVREGGGANAYRHADKLRTLFTDERRHINPKYGREYDEFNAVRWLMLSNHESALPLDRFDRRVYAIRNPDEPRGAEYYARLYAMAADPLFVSSVREALRRRDISRFNPGMPAPLTETKRSVIEASMSEAELEMQEVAASYPSDCIATDVLGNRLFGMDSRKGERAALRYIAPRADAQRYGRRVTVRGIQLAVWVLRNHSKWMGAQPDAVAEEVERGEQIEHAFWLRNNPKRGARPDAVAKEAERGEPRKGKRGSKA